ncbi:MAG: 5'-nucleotidase [Propionibacteriaceae bacterium]|nr:5'-nucleotidase [Propionibacteriaceae bacterium]
MALLSVGVASSALFDLSESHQVFQQYGVEAYRQYQQDNLNRPLRPGPAQPFLRRLLALNDVVADAVDVIVLSRNSADTGLRVMRSIEAAGLPITRAVFREGLSPFEFIPALGMSLFLSANPQDVADAVADGHPAGTVLSGGAVEDRGEGLLVAFDFDGVLADDSAERVFQTQGLGRYAIREAELAQVPLTPGPLAGFLEGLNQIQAVEADRAARDPEYQRQLRVALVTARSAPAHERAINSLRVWGLRVDDAFFLGGREKAPVLEVLRPHLFFDDQRRHLDQAAGRTPSVHVPFGICNAPTNAQVDRTLPARRAAASLLNETA